MKGRTRFYAVVTFFAAAIARAASLSAAVEVTLIVDPNPVIAGQIVTFSGDVTNLGPATATKFDVQIPGPFPNVFQLVDVVTTPSVPCATTTGTVTCSIGTVDVGQSFHFDVRLRADETYYGPVGGVLDGAAAVRELNSPNLPTIVSVATFHLEVLPLSAIPALSPLMLCLVCGTFALVAVKRLR